MASLFLFSHLLYFVLSFQLQHLGHLESETFFTSHSHDPVLQHIGLMKRHTCDIAPSFPSIYWLESLGHANLGYAPYASSPTIYRTFRNVKDYGAKGDGKTDDTNAINRAISDGQRCGKGCPASTTTPATVYFPSGTYLVSKPILQYYYTQIVGDAIKPPTIKAAKTFSFSTAGAGIAVIDADPYDVNGGNWYYNTLQFFRSIRNIVIDTTSIPADKVARGVHWQVSQGTSLQNVVVKMNQAVGSKHQGVYIENGSGGVLTDLTTVGGHIGLYIGNQQFTVRNVTARNAQGSGVYVAWNWGMTFLGTTFRNCSIGFDLSAKARHVLISDSNTISTPIFLRTPSESATWSIILDNIYLKYVTNTFVQGSKAKISGPGFNKIKRLGWWVHGRTYTGSATSPSVTSGTYNMGWNKPSALLDDNVKWFVRSRPQYESYGSSEFVSIKSLGAKGDGKTDDTAIINAALKSYAGCKIIYFEAGIYRVKNTVHVPVGTRMFGDGYPVIRSAGARFANTSNPRPVIKVGSQGESGVVEISGMIFGVEAGSGGAVVVEWNVDAGKNGGMWDTHVRIGGVHGTLLRYEQCQKQRDNGDHCVAANLGLRITKSASGYFENNWVWVADHDIDDQNQRQIDVYAPRGVLVESTKGPVWLMGLGSEHFSLYEINIVGASNVYLGFIQTETPYYQPTASPSWPVIDTDPPSVDSAWGLSITKSSNVIIGSSGLYSWFRSYTQNCSTTKDCQDRIARVDSASSDIRMLGMSTVRSEWMLTMNGRDTIGQTENWNALASTYTLWRSE